MEGLVHLRQRGKGSVPLLDPCRYVREADQAMEDGDREQAVSLIRQAFLAFDLCSNWCRQVKRSGRDPRERNS